MTLRCCFLELWITCGITAVLVLFRHNHKIVWHVPRAYIDLITYCVRMIDFIYLHTMSVSTPEWIWWWLAFLIESWSLLTLMIICSPWRRFHVTHNVSLHMAVLRQQREVPRCFSLLRWAAWETEVSYDWSTPGNHKDLKNLLLNTMNLVAYLDESR